MKRKKNKNLFEKYPPSEPCSCETCRSFCKRPGWWTVEEAAKAMEAGYWTRMMLEMSPDFKFGVLSPAFNGCEQDFALQQFASSGCNFYKNGLCELFDSGFEPLECRFCHHERAGQGLKCHTDLEKDWNTQAGKDLIAKWCSWTGIGAKYGLGFGGLPRY